MVAGEIDTVDSDGHSWGSWRAHLDDILKAFAGRKRDADGC